MLKVIICKGLPASGKTTRAKEMVQNNPGKYKRINKDDLRAMLDCSKFSKTNERIVLETRNMLILKSLENGFNVIVDDTNFNEIHIEDIKKLVYGKKVLVEIKSFLDVSLEECIERDKNRSNPVGEAVITEMYMKYIHTAPQKTEYDWNLPDCIICDIDGTLADMGDRDPYDTTNAMNDNIIRQTRFFVMNRNPHHKLIITTGRMESSREITEERLRKTGIEHDILYMRPQDDTRKDSIIKEEMYNEHIKGKYNVFCVFDDRPQVVRMRRSLGLFVFDCNQEGRDF